MAALYRDVIIAGPCEGADLLGPWWEMRLAHTVSCWAGHGSISKKEFISDEVLDSRGRVQHPQRHWSRLRVIQASQGLLRRILLQGWSNPKFAASIQGTVLLYFVGPEVDSPQIVLVFSVGLQLSGFFTAVSSGLWLSKVTHGNFKALIRHEALYITGFVVILLVSSLLNHKGDDSEPCVCV